MQGGGGMPNRSTGSSGQVRSEVVNDLLRRIDEHYADRATEALLGKARRPKIDTHEVWLTYLRQRYEPQPKPTEEEKP